MENIEITQAIEEFKNRWKLTLLTTMKNMLQPKFVKKLDNVLEVSIPPIASTKKALFLLDYGLIRQLTSIWPSPKVTKTWAQQN